MIIKESFEVPADKDAAVDFFLDVERMSSCVPGIESVEQVGDEYQAVLRMQLGPIRSEFHGRASVDDSGAPDRLMATAQGRDRATGSQVQVTFSADLTEHPGPRTVIDTTADVTIRGRLGQFGTGLITSTAKSVLREFAECAGRKLTEGDDAPGASAQAPSMGRLLRRSAGIYVSDRADRMRSRFGRGAGDKPADAPPQDES